MPLHVTITGATGFIGSAVLSELLSYGYKVTVLLRQESDTARLTEQSGFVKLVYRQLQDESILSELRKTKPDVFIHCGWRGVGGDRRNEVYQITENLPSTLASVELAAAAGCRQWIGLGSQAEYGNQNQRLDENSPLRPTTLYGKSKLAAGVAALALCEAHQMNGVWLRVFSTYGPGDSARWFIPYVVGEFLASRVPKLTKCAQLWDYLYIADAARAVRSIADGRTVGVFNLGSGSAKPLKDYIEAIRSEIGSTCEPEYGAVEYRPDQVMHLEANIASLTASTGWIPETSLEDGVQATVAFERIRNRDNQTSRK